MSIERDVMTYDVLIVGAGPAGLSAAIRLKQRAAEAGSELSVCVVEKGSEVGAHILSGAVFETRALDELIPNWRELHAPVQTAVTRDEVYFFTSAEKAIRIPGGLIPKPMHNTGNYIISLGQLCRWLATQAEAQGVEIYPGFAAQTPIIDAGIVRGVTIGDMGVGRDGKPKPEFTPGLELRAKYTFFSEGCRGHLGKQLIEHFNLAADADPQHYAIGLKEVWTVEPERHRPGLVVHGTGWPLDSDSSGGFFLYHAENHQVFVGLIVDLSYRNPYLSPFEEFQRFKHHPIAKQALENGSRTSYGARAIVKGGLNSLPQMSFPGGLLIGDDAGTLNFSKIKGSHTAMKSGMLAADTAADALLSGSEGGDELTAYSEKFKASWLHQELRTSRNFGSHLHRFGPVLGGGLNYIEQNWFGGNFPWTIRDTVPDHQTLKLASNTKPTVYPRPDGKLSFDRLSSVFLSSTSHEEDQPPHLTLKDPTVPVRHNLPRYAEPAQRYCPAGVYEIVDQDSSQPRLQINAQNCVHCKTCDIKDPAQNIVWIAPEGGGGPSYANM